MGKIACPSCGAEMYDTELTCPACGAPRRAAGSQPPGPTRPVPPAMRSPGRSRKPLQVGVVLLLVAGAAVLLVLPKVRLATFTANLTDEVNAMMARAEVTETMYRQSGRSATKEKIGTVSAKCNIYDLRVIKPQKGAERIWYFEGRLGTLGQRDNGTTPKPAEQNSFWKMVYGPAPIPAGTDPEDKVNGIIYWQQHKINVDFFMQFGSIERRVDLTREYSSEDWDRLFGRLAPSK